MAGHAPVRDKVKAAAAGSGAAGVVTPFAVWVLDQLFWNGDADPVVPLPVVGMVGLVVGYGIAFAAGYFKTETTTQADPGGEG